jgi:hypothetical protein
MSLDDRLRDELRHDASRIDPDVEANLRAVEARGTRPKLPVSTVLAGAAIVAAIVLIGRFGVPSGPAATAPPSGATGLISGTYSTTLAASDRGVADHGLAGTWALRIDPDGVAVLTPPAGFQAGAASFPGIAISVDGDRMRTDAFYTDYCSSVGTYRWVDANGALRFEPIDDTCAIRVSLLSTQPWTRAP